jgi:hypothetical protein
MSLCLTTAVPTTPQLVPTLRWLSWPQKLHLGDLAGFVMDYNPGFCPMLEEDSYPVTEM